MAKLWGDCGLTEIETTSFHVSRSFKNFEEYWNTSSVGPSVATTLTSLSSDVVDNIKFKLNETLERDVEGNITARAFANAVKGIKPNRS